MSKIKVAITDDHPMVADGIQNALHSTIDFEVTAVYGSGVELLNGIRATTIPDVLLLDVQLPDRSGIDLARQLVKEHPGMKIIILTGTESHLIIEDLMKAGCSGYLQKSITNKEVLIKAIKTAYDGSIYLTPEHKDQLLRNMLDTRQRPVNHSKKLTAREKDVLRLIAAEYTNQEIADLLYISLRTVENHRHNLLQKLEVKNAVGLVKAAIKMGLTDE